MRKNFITQTIQRRLRWESRNAYIANIGTGHFFIAESRPAAPRLILNEKKLYNTNHSAKTPLGIFDMVRILAELLLFSLPDTTCTG